MRTAIAMLQSVSPYSQGKHYNVPKLEKESPGDYEQRTWRERCHSDADGHMTIPPMAFKNCLSDAAKYLSIQVQGKGKSTYTKHFVAGVLVTEPLVLPIKVKDVPGQWVFVPSDGKRGGGKRVEKCFPVIQEWSGAVEFHILDETITKDVFTRHLEEAGKFIGIGVFRPINNGYFGRLKIEKLEWK